MTIRRAAPGDAAECGPICYKAFHKISSDHNFPPDVPSAEAGTGLMSMLFSHPLFYCLVAEIEGKVVGSNCLDERSIIAGVGPITVDPAAQNTGVGRELMNAVLTRAQLQKFAGVRLVQAAFHTRSLALYTKLGFVVREPLAVFQGKAIHQKFDGCKVRAAATADIDECNSVCMQVHGFSRGGELSDAIGHGGATVVERGGRITGYSTVMAFFGHSVGETNLDLQALIGAADAFGGPGIIVPMRNAEVFKWCLDQGLRVIQPLTLMTKGLYSEPAGAFLPSIVF